MNWCQAFARQAQSDLQVYRILSASNLPNCHRLQVLHAALEKAAKARLAHPERSYKATHEIAESLIGACKIDTQLKSKLGFRNTPSYNSYLSTIKKMAVGLEAYNPKVATTRAGDAGQNFEYPYKGVNGHIVAPANLAFRSDFRSEGNLVKFLEAILELVS